MAVQVGAGPVVAHRGARVGVAGRDLDVPEIHAGIETGRERITNHVEYLSRSGAPGGHFQGWWLRVRICPAMSQVQVRASAARRLRCVVAASAARRPGGVTGDLAAARRSVSGPGMHEVQRELLVARWDAWRDQ